MGFYSPFLLSSHIPKKKKWTVLKYGTLFLFSMIGITNNIYKKDEIERVNLTLLTNQSTHDNLIGLNFTLTYGNYILSSLWRKKKIAQRWERKRAGFCPEFVEQGYSRLILRFQRLKGT